MYVLRAKCVAAEPEGLNSWHRSQETHTHTHFATILLNITANDSQITSYCHWKVVHVLCLCNSFVTQNIFQSEVVNPTPKHLAGESTLAACPRRRHVWRPPLQFPTAWRGKISHIKIQITFYRNVLALYEIYYYYYYSPPPRYVEGGMRHSTLLPLIGLIAGKWNGNILGKRRSVCQEISLFHKKVRHWTRWIKSTNSHSIIYIWDSF